MKTALALVTTRMMCGQIEHLAYEILDGDEQGIVFYAYDHDDPGAPEPLTTVRVKYTPEDQFARAIPTYPALESMLSAGATHAIVRPLVTLYYRRSRISPHDPRWASCAVNRVTGHADNWILWGDLPEGATEI